MTTRREIWEFRRIPDVILVSLEAFRLAGTMVAWQDWQDQNTHASKELLKEKVAAGLSADKPKRTTQALNQWARQQAEMLVELLQAMQ